MIGVRADTMPSAFEWADGLAWACWGFSSTTTCWVAGTAGLAALRLADAVAAEASARQATDAMVTASLPPRMRRPVIPARRVIR